MIERSFVVIMGSLLKNVLTSWYFNSAISGLRKEKTGNYISCLVIRLTEHSSGKQMLLIGASLLVYFDGFTIRCIFIERNSICQPTWSISYPPLTHFDHLEIIAHCFRIEESPIISNL